MSPQSDITLSTPDELLESLRKFGSDFAASFLRSLNRIRRPKKTRTAETRTRTPPTTAGIRTPYFEATMRGIDEVVGVVSDIEAVVGLARRAVNSEAMVGRCQKGKKCAKPSRPWVARNVDAGGSFYSLAEIF